MASHQTPDDRDPRVQLAVLKEKVDALHREMERCHETIKCDIDENRKLIRDINRRAFLGNGLESLHDRIRDHDRSLRMITRFLYVVGTSGLLYVLSKLWPVLTEAIGRQ